MNTIIKKIIGILFIIGFVIVMNSCTCNRIYVGGHMNTVYLDYFKTKKSTKINDKYDSHRREDFMIIKKEGEI